MNRIGRAKLAPVEMEETANSNTRQISDPQVADLSLATIGLLLATVGTVLTCGLLAPIGLAVSLFALKDKPRKTAIAGVMIGTMGVCLLCVLAFAVYGIYFMSAEEEHPIAELMDKVPLQRAQAQIEDWRKQNAKPPSFDVGQRLIDDIPDRWGRPILYLPVEEGYFILSAGEDGELLTADDVWLRNDNE